MGFDLDLMGNSADGLFNYYNGCLSGQFEFSGLTQSEFLLNYGPANLSNFIAFSNDRLLETVSNNTIGSSWNMPSGNVISDNSGSIKITIPGTVSHLIGLNVGIIEESPSSNLDVNGSLAVKWRVIDIDIDDGYIEISTEGDDYGIEVNHSVEWTGATDSGVFYLPPG